MDNKAPRHSHTKEQRLRLQLAQEAARLMVEEGIEDFNNAKQKAASRLHLPRGQSLPSNDEIQQALLEYQRLFKSETQPHSLLRLRQAALKAMSFFKTFEPRLVGAVADGSASEYSTITLHLFADDSEALHLFMINQRLPYELGSQRISATNGQLVEQPVYRMELEGCAIELIVFDHIRMRQAPRDPVTHKPMQRLDIKKVEELIRLTEPSQPTLY